MKTLVSVALVSVVSLLSLFSCDHKLLRSAAQTVEAQVQELVLPDDADFVSFTGERYEKYRFQLDPVIYNRSVTLSGSADTSYRSTRPVQVDTYYWDYRTYTGSNTMSITTTLRDINDPATPATIRVPATGRLGYGCTYKNYDEGDDRATLLYADINTSVSIPTSAVSVYYEEKDILRSFSSASLALPLTADYSDPYREYKYHTYKYTFPASTLLASSPGAPSVPFRNSNSPYNITWNMTPLQTNIAISSENTFDPYVLASRDFYQYKSFTIRYQPGLVIHGCIVKPYPHPVVKALDYDPDENSITVTFNPYNTPYQGPLFYYYVEAEDGTWREKTVSIE